MSLHERFTQLGRIETKPPPNRKSAPPLPSRPAPRRARSPPPPPPPPQITRPYYPEQRTYAPPASRSTMEPELYSYRRPPQRSTSTYRPYQSYDENPNSFLDRWSSPDREFDGGRSGYLRRPASPEPYVERGGGMRSNGHSATFAAAMKIKQRSIHQRLGRVKRPGAYSDSYSPRWSRRSSDWDLPLPSFRRNRRGGYGGGMYSSLSFNRSRGWAGSTASLASDGTGRRSRSRFRNRNRGWGGGGGRGRRGFRGRRGRSQGPPISREELDKELDLYMAQGPNAKAALDKDLDSYMAQAK